MINKCFNDEKYVTSHWKNETYKLGKNFKNVYQNTKIVYLRDNLKIERF